MEYCRIVFLAVFATVVTSLPWHDGFPPGRSGSQNYPENNSRKEVLISHNLPGAICSITQYGSRRQFPCYPNNLFTCEATQELPDFASATGITELSICVPISCENGGDRICYNADWNSRCAQPAPEVNENDFKAQAKQLCPNMRLDDDYDDDHNEDSDDGSDEDDDNTMQPPTPPTSKSTPRSTSTSTTQQSTVTPQRTSPRTPSPSPTQPHTFGTYTPPTETPPTRITIVTRITQPPYSTATQPSVQNLVLMPQGRRCTLSSEVRLAQRACRIDSRSGVIRRDCPPLEDGSIPGCNTSPDCQVTINSQSVTLYMCSIGNGNPNAWVPPGQGGSGPPWSQGQGNQGPPQGQNPGQGQNQGQRQGRDQGQGQGQGQTSGRGRGNSRGSQGKGNQRNNGRD